MKNTEVVFNIEVNQRNVRLEYRQKSYYKNNFIKLCSYEGRKQILNIIKDIDVKFSEVVVVHYSNSHSAIKYVSEFYPITILDEKFFYGISHDYHRERITIYLFS